MTQKKQVLASDEVVKQGVAAFRKLRDVELNSEDTLTNILNDDNRGKKWVNITVTMKKMSTMQKMLLVPFTFPHSTLRKDDEVCLIIGCRDEDRNNKRADHERWANEFKQKLRSVGVDRDIHVLPLMQLTTEYTQFEAKRRLCKAFDHFLCDHRILSKMPKLLGCTFFKKGKMPIRVYLKEDEKIKYEIELGLKKVIIQISPDGTNFSVRVGNLVDHTDAEIVENVRALLDNFIPQHFPGGESNVNSIHFASFDGKAVPLYVSLTSPNEVDLSQTDKKFNEEIIPTEFEDEIDTLPGVKVKVRSDGKVIALKDDAVQMTTEELLDEDYLDVFRTQETEEKDEGKKRFVKHLARKAALRKIGKTFGPNMLKLPSHAPVAKPKSKLNLPKQVPAAVKPQPPKVPQDTLQGYDDEHSEDDCPQLVPAKKAKRSSLTKGDTSFKVDSVAAKSLKKQRRSTSAFTEQALEQVKNKSAKKAARKSEGFKVEGIKPQSEKKLVKAQGMFVEAMGTLGKEVTTPRTSPTKSPAGTPKPILKTPKDKGSAERRKSVTFDFTPLHDKQLKTPQDTDPTPINTPGSQTKSGKKRRSLAGGFDATPVYMKKTKKQSA